MVFGPGCSHRPSHSSSTATSTSSRHTALRSRDQMPSPWEGFSQPRVWRRISCPGRDARSSSYGRTARRSSWPWTRVRWAPWNGTPAQARSCFPKERSACSGSRPERFQGARRIYSASCIRTTGDVQLPHSRSRAVESTSSCGSCAVTESMSGWSFVLGRYGRRATTSRGSSVFWWT